jgi:DNA polymerase-3 subunit beta
MDIGDDECQTFSIKSNDLKDVVEKTSFAMAQQDVRYYLNGLFFGLSKSGVLGVATDGHRLAKTEIKSETNIEESTSVIIPRKGISEIIKQIEGENIVMSGVISKNHLKITGGQTEAITKLVDGKFPDYEKVIPENANKKVVIDSKDLREALSRVSILSNDRFRGVRLNFNNNELRVSANNPEKEEASDDIKANYAGEEIEVGFNVNYLLDVLSVVKTKNVQIFLKDSNSSALLMPENDDTSNYVVMPLRL